VTHSELLVYLNHLMTTVNLRIFYWILLLRKLQDIQVF